MKRINNFLASILKFLPDDVLCRITFFLKHGRFPNLRKPKLLNDRLLYLKLTDRNPIYSQMVDKSTVRNYVGDKIGYKYLIPLIGIYDKVEDINYNKLPDRFVLKITNGSQNNFVCKDKRAINWNKMIKKIKLWCKKDYYVRTREWPYKNVVNRILIEELIDGDDGDLKDYKFWCFNGIPKFVQVDSGRFTKHKRDFYDISFNKKLPFQMSYPNTKWKLPKPNNYNKMVQIASQLSKGFQFLRVDLYNVTGKIYFGELTFYPDNCNGKIIPIEYEKKIGDQMDLKFVEHNLTSSD